MTAPHDTPEAVEAMAYAVERNPSHAIPASPAAAMLRRLHQRAVDAERERDEAHYDACRTVTRCLAEAKASARADALREAAEVASAEERRFPNFSLQHAGEIMTARRIAAAILAIIQPTTGET